MDARLLDYLRRILTARVYDVAAETPLERAGKLSDRTRNSVWLKREDTQPVFSFKLRGAYNKMARLPADQLARGVICASAGNHAQGVALSARRLNCRAVIVMPVTTPRLKSDAVNKHIRCKPDEVIRAIADTGGYVGVCCIPSFLGGGITAFLDHIDYLVKKFGANRVAIGTDVAHSSPSKPGDGKPIGPARKTRTRFEALWPKGSLEGATDPGRTLAWTNWPLFTVGVVQRGHTDDDIRKILGGNVLRVARAALKDVPGLSPAR